MKYLTSVSNFQKFRLTILLIVVLLSFNLNTQSIQLVKGDNTTGLYDNAVVHMVPMRDGIKLATNVYLPKSYTKPLPTLLIRTPYSKDAFWIGSRGFYDNALLQALQFPVVVQDVRGRDGHRLAWHNMPKPSLKLPV
jgi:hypothetical protein